MIPPAKIPLWNAFTLKFWRPWKSTGGVTKRCTAISSPGPRAGSVGLKVTSQFAGIGKLLRSCFGGTKLMVPGSCRGGGLGCLLMRWLHGSSGGMSYVSTSKRYVCRSLVSLRNWNSNAAGECALPTSVFSWPRLLLGFRSSIHSSRILQTVVTGFVRRLPWNGGKGGMVGTALYTQVDMGFSDEMRLGADAKA